MSSFREEIDRIRNQPINLIQREVIDFMRSSEYQTYARLVYPFDRPVFIYDKNHKTLFGFLESISDVNLFGSRLTEERNMVLMDALVHLFNYLSTQYSLLKVLESHANGLEMKNQLQSQFSRLRRDRVTRFINHFRHNLVHQINFSNALRFESMWKRPKIVYDVSELVKGGKWSKQTIDDFSNGTDFVVIEDVISKYHSLVIDSLERYESTLFRGHESTFKAVLNRLLEFSRIYESNGGNGFLPVSEEYIIKKLKLYEV